MSSPRGHLALARKLLSVRAKKFDDAALRRAVSTAYYALFHLLTEAAAGLYVPPSSAHAGAIRRTFNHDPMRAVSGMVSDGNLPRLFGKPGSFALADDLRAVAKAFVDLQVERENADYEHSRPVRSEKAEMLVAQAERAFASWEKVKNTDEARLYLASFLLHKTWNQDPRGASPKRPDNTEGNPT
jgi:uncharacterized protein (UPF0332 family)